MSGISASIVIAVSSSCIKLAATAGGDSESALESSISEISMASEKASFACGIYDDDRCRIVDDCGAECSSSDNRPSVPSELRSLMIILTRARETGAGAGLEERDEESSS